MIQLFHRSIRIGLLFHLLVIGLSFTEESNAQTWETEELSPLPEPVTNNAVSEGRVGDTLYIYSFGGIDSTKLYSGIHRKCWQYNMMSDVWEELPLLPDTLGKIATAASRIGDTIYIIGGYYVFENGSELSSSRLHRFDIQTNSFVSDGEPIPVPIDDHVQAVWRDSLIYVVTGWSDRRNVPDVQIYDPSNDQWTEGTSVPNNNRFMSFGASGVIIEDTIYYYGGAAFGSSFPIQNQIRKGVIDPSDPTSITWSEVQVDDVPAGYRTGATVISGKIYWIGGSEITYNFDGVAYNGSGGVDPTGRIIGYDPVRGAWFSSSAFNLPMDLRGVGTMNQRAKIIVGGMEKGQRVSQRTLMLRLRSESSVHQEVKERAESELQIYQSDGTMRIRHPKPNQGNFTIGLFDLLGKSALPLLQSAFEEETIIDVRQVLPGSYVLRVRGEGEVWHKKVMLLR